MNQLTQAAQTGSPLTWDLDVSWESEIVWLRGGPDDYPYLREGFTRANTRARRPRPLSETVVAYATLRLGAPGVSPGRFERRLWSFQEDRDPYPCEKTHPNYENVAPMQGVKPHSIAAGRRSELGRE